MRNLVVFSHAVADETRWRILQLIFDQALCVCELADILDMPQSSVSSHVQVIRKAGLLDSEKCEKWIYYKVASSHRKLIASLSKFFDASPATNSALAADAAAAELRLSQRETSCCPPPVELATRSKALLRTRP